MVLHMRGLEARQKGRQTQRWTIERQVRLGQNVDTLKARSLRRQIPRWTLGRHVERWSLRNKFE